MVRTIAVPPEKGHYVTTERISAAVHHHSDGIQSRLSNIAPPDPHWFHLWLAKYPTETILDAINVLAAHPLKTRFTTESTGKALSAWLRAEALRRAVIPVSAAVRP